MHCPETPVRMSLVIAFADIAGFAKHAAKLEDEEVFAWMNAFYGRVETAVSAADGLVVKYIGDAVLMVFPGDRAAGAVQCLAELRNETNAWLADVAPDTSLGVKAHLGEPIAGLIGSGENRRFDVLGNAVNDTARLKGHGLILSETLRRAIDADV